MMYVLAAAVIAAASFLFAMLGLGGGMVYVPILHWMGFDLKTVAIPLGLLLNGLNTFLALTVYARKGLVDWRGGAAMGIAATVGAPLGALVQPMVAIERGHLDRGYLGHRRTSERITALSGREHLCSGMGCVIAMPGYNFCEPQAP